jgi:hypothetical protein
LPHAVRQLCRERIDAAPAGRADPHDLRCLAATDVILGRYTEAATTCAALAATSGSSQDWAREIGAEARVRGLLLQQERSVVVDALSTTIDRQMTHLGLPTTR